MASGRLEVSLSLAYKKPAGYSPVISILRNLKILDRLAEISPQSEEGIRELKSSWSGDMNCHARSVQCQIYAAL